MSDTTDGRGKHPNSRKALVPGGKAGVRVLLTKNLVNNRVEWLTANEETLNEMMAQLSPRDWVAAYLKMIDLIVPKKQDITMSEGIPEQTFQINFGTPTPDQQLALQEAENVIDITPEADEQLPGFDTLYDFRHGDENSAHDE